ncbi:helix-turn-helix transcriptional regulator [Streptomyces sp. LE64]|uniref:helix-turn-helix transcriptional regulator n=1 Tax=Streptomyces sp. LE64 TaxID=3448653 RepID=UPI0040438A98
MVSETRSPHGRRAQLRDFLRTRRARLTPEDVGLPPGERRRTPGLRREEVAILAGVGVSWYTWLEQGRDINASAEVLDAVARTLRLSGPERVHLYLLAGLNPPAAGPVRTEVTPQLQGLIDAWAPRPAILRDRHWNLVVVNDSAREVFGYDTTDHNCLFTFFTNRRYRSAHTDWERIAPEVVAAFRADCARHPGDPEFGRIVDELNASSAEFAALWARHDVAEVTQAVKAIHHPELGRMVFDTTVLALAEWPGHRLELQNPQPGSGTAAKLDALAAARSARAH